VPGLRIVRQEIEDVIGLRERAGQLVGSDHGEAFFSARLAPHRDDAHFERGEQFHEMRSNGAEAQNDHALSARRASSVPDAIPLRRAIGRVGGQRRGQTPRLREQKGQGMLGARLCVDTRTVRHDEPAVGGEGAKLRVVVAGEPRAREVNPLQALRTGDARDVGLAEGHFRARKHGIGFGFRQHRRRQFPREQKFMRRHSGAQQFRGAFAQLRIRKDLHRRMAEESASVREVELSRRKNEECLST
jgi:hypothetical protein